MVVILRIAWQFPRWQWLVATGFAIHLPNEGWEKFCLLQHEGNVCFAFSFYWEAI